MINGINPFYMDYNSYEMKKFSPQKEAVSDEDREKRANASEDDVSKLNSAASLVAAFSKDLGMTFGSGNTTNNTSNTQSLNNSTTTVTGSGGNKTVTTITPLNINYGNSKGASDETKQKVSDIISQFFKSSSFATKYDNLLEKFGLKTATSTNNSNNTDNTDNADKVDNSDSVNKDISSGMSQEELNEIITKKKVA